MKKSILLAATLATSIISAQYTGKTGINTTAPAKTLDVNGNFQTISAPSDGITDGIETNTVYNSNQGVLVYSVKGSADDLFGANIANSALLVYPDNSTLITNDENNNSSQLSTMSGETIWNAYGQSPDTYISNITQGRNGIKGEVTKSGTASSFALTNTGFAVSNSGLGNVTSTLMTFGSFSAPIRKASGSISSNDYTILGTGDCTLPSPATAQGRIYNFVYDGTDYNVLGSLRLNGTVISNYGMNSSNPTKRITVQSDGNNWVILL